MTDKIMIYKKPTCVQCTAVLRSFDTAGVDYDIVDLTQDDAAMNMVMNELGYRQVPVVIYKDLHFAGFMPGKIAEVVEAYKNADAAPEMAA